MIASNHNNTKWFFSGESSSEKAGVGGSIPSLATTF